MENLFVPFEIALEMKLLNFNHPCLGYYGEINGGEIQFFLKKDFDSETPGVLSPTFSQAFDWFREKYNLHSVFEHDSDNYYYVIQGINDIKFDTIDASEEGIVYKTYEEAELECLKKLIEIVKKEKS